MNTGEQTVAFPDLRILPIDHLHPHEEHDPQRAQPLIKRLAEAEFFTNPPIVTQVGDDEYIVLDGANRYTCFAHLGFKHILAQVVDYDSEAVELGVWQHIISDWDEETFTKALETLQHSTIQQGWDTTHAVSQIMLHNGTVMSLNAPADTIEARNQALREIVGVYRQRAALYRTALTDPTLIWPLYPDAVALVLFPLYEPADIIASARQHAYLPPGVSRHVIHGRALMLNYPMSALLDNGKGTAAKNEDLQNWLRTRLSKRAIRYYAESTYQFSE